MSCSVAAATHELAPRPLYTRLLTSPYPDSQLPGGFTSAKVGSQKPTSQGLRYHELGVVAATVDGPDAVDGVLFYVFPNAADARADLAHPDLSQSNARKVGTVPGVALPSELVAGSITGKNAFGKTVTNGITGAVVQKGNVLVAAFTVSTANTDSGNVPASLALLRSALKHLEAVSS